MLYQPTRNETTFRNISIFWNTCIVASVAWAGFYTNITSSKVTEPIPQHAPSVIVVDDQGMTAADRAVQVLEEPPSPIQSPLGGNTHEARKYPFTPPTEATPPQGFYTTRGSWVPKVPNNNTDEFEDLSNGTDR